MDVSDAYDLNDIIIVLKSEQIDVTEDVPDDIEFLGGKDTTEDPEPEDDIQKKKEVFWDRIGIDNLEKVVG